MQKQQIKKLWNDIPVQKVSKLLHGYRCAVMIASPVVGQVRVLDGKGLTLRPTGVTSEAQARAMLYSRLAGAPQKMSETNAEKIVPAPYLQQTAGKVYRMNCTAPATGQSAFMTPVCNLPLSARSEMSVGPPLVLNTGDRTCA